MDIKSDSDSITEVGTKSPALATGCLGMLGGCRTSGANLRSSDGDGPVHRVSELMDASPLSNAEIANRNSISHRSRLSSKADRNNVQMIDKQK